MAFFKRPRRTVRNGRYKALCVAALIGGLVTVGVHPAEAKTIRITHPEQDWMGSQIAKHEGAPVHDLVIKR